MQWSDVIKPPPAKQLRQFAGLFLIVFLGLAAWRWHSGQRGAITIAMGAIAIVVGVVGLIVPAAVRPIYTGWMVAAFPIGWTVSRIILGTVFYLVITPLAWIFGLTGRDVLSRRRRTATTYWQNKGQAAPHASYFRQF